MFKLLVSMGIFLSCQPVLALELTHMATLANLQGSAAQVEILTPEGMRMVPSIGSKIANGTRIKTSTNVVVQILYDDGSQTIIGPNSELLINSSQPSAVDATLYQGKIRSKVSKAPPTFDPKAKQKPKYIIHTGAMTLGVRGTDFTVDTPSTHDRVQVEILDGVVDLWKAPTEKFETPDRRLRPGDGVEVRSTGDEAVYRISAQTYGRMDSGVAGGNSSSKVATNRGRVYDLVDSLMSYFKGLVDWIKSKL
jgi:hypothetical protein